MHFCFFILSVISSVFIYFGILKTKTTRSVILFYTFRDINFERSKRSIHISDERSQPCRVHTQTIIYFVISFVLLWNDFLESVVELASANISKNRLVKTDLKP